MLFTYYFFRYCVCTWSHYLLYITGIILPYTVLYYWIVFSGRVFKIELWNKLENLAFGGDPRVTVCCVTSDVWCCTFWIAFYFDVYPLLSETSGCCGAVPRSRKAGRRKKQAFWCFLWLGMVWVICFLGLVEGDHMPKSLKTQGTAWQCCCLVGKCVMVIVISIPTGAPPHDFASYHCRDLYLAPDGQLPLFAGWKWDRATLRWCRSRAQCLEKLTCTLRCCQTPPTCPNKGMEWT